MDDKGLKTKKKQSLEEILKKSSPSHEDSKQDGKEIKKAKRNFQKKLAQNITQDSKSFFGNARSKSKCKTETHTHTHTHPFNGPLSRTTRVSPYQKGKTSLDFTEARVSEWQWH